VREGPTIKIIDGGLLQEEAKDDPYEHYNSNAIDHLLITEGKASP